MQATPIKRRITWVILLTSIAVLALTSTAFVIYEVIASSQELRRGVEVAGQIVGAQCTAPLLYQGQEDAQEILASLAAAKSISLAALYDTNSMLFAFYPTNALPSQFPEASPPVQIRFHWDRLIWCQEVYEHEKFVGTLLLESNLTPLYDRVRLYIFIGALVMGGSLVMALLLSNHLQKGISRPILELAQTARVISQDRDYSVRAQKMGEDELGVLTDAFNHMLAQIQDRESALRESADRLRLALQASQVGTWDWNIQTNQLYWDDSILRQFGLQPRAESLSLQDFIHRIHPEDRRFVQQGMEESIRHAREFRSEFRVVWPSGAIRHLAARGKAICDDAGTAVRMTGVSLDITERKTAEEVQSLLAAIVESSDDAIIGKDLQGRIVSWNTGAERMFGYTSQEMVGQSITRLTAPDRPDEEEQILERIRTGSPVERYETVRVRRDGTMLQIALSVSPIRNRQGDIVGVSSIARDITERKRAEHVLARQAAVLREQAQLLDLATVLARDLEDRIILWSAGMEQLYGWTKTEVLGQASHMLLKTEFSQQPEEIRAQLFAAGEWRGEVVHHRRDGTRLAVASHWVLHKDEHGRPAAILEVYNDITQRKLAEEEIRRLNADLEQRVRDRTAELTAANRELEAFTYSVSHDLRAPLRHIDAFARILHEEASSQLSPELRSYISRIRKSAQTMGRLVDDLLNLSRVGRAQPTWQTIALRNLVEEVISDLRDEYAGRQVSWQLGDLPMAECDPGLIKQVFANLLSNAVKYTRPREQAVIEIGTVQIDSQPAVFVRDNGVGFNMKYAHKLFGVFERLHRPEEFEGTGIGLATVRRIVQKHGGQVWAESESNKATTFYFTLEGMKPPNQPLPSPSESVASREPV